MPHKEEPQPPQKDKDLPDRIKSAIQLAEGQIEVDAVELKTIEIRLNGVKEATQRSRFVFLVMTIVASAILITLWNGMLAWDRGHAFPHSTWGWNDRTIRNRDELVSEWIKDQTISVGLLGIRIGVSDLTVIGSASLIVIMAWYFFSQRRENRAIVSLLRDCTEGFKEWRLSKDICWMVYQGIVHSLVFIDAGKGDSAMSGLEPEKPNAKNKSTLLIRKVVRVLVYLPPFTILMVMFSDIASLFFMSSAFRQSSEALWRVLLLPENRVDLIKVILFDSFALATTIYIGYLCYLSRKFSTATTSTLRDFEKVIEDSEMFLKDPDVFLKELEKEKQ